MRSLRLLPLLLIAQGAGAGDPASLSSLEATPAKPLATELEPITVTPRFNPFDAQRDRLRKMVEDPTCQGCPPPLTFDRESIYLKVGSFIGSFTGYGLEPPTMADPEERQDFYLGNAWRMESGQ